MGYSATFDGMIILSTKLDPLELQEKAQEVFLNNVAVTDLCDHDYTLWLGGYERYLDDEVFAFLQHIRPYTISGEIEYCGDDNSLWRHVFDPERKQWLEQDGEVVYESDGQTIPDLMEQITRLQANMQPSQKSKESDHSR